MSATAYHASPAPPRRRPLHRSRRALYATGWLHQSVRMVVASFLIEYLGVSWVEGAKWFHETLIDADLAINSMMWQK